MYWRVNSVLEQNPKIGIYNKQVEKFQFNVFSTDTEYLWYVCTMAQKSITSVIERIKKQCIYIKYNVYYGPFTRYMNTYCASQKNVLRWGALSVGAEKIGKENEKSSINLKVADNYPGI